MGRGVTTLIDICLPFEPPGLPDLWLMSRRVKRVKSNRETERNMGEEWRVPFPTWSTFNISDSIEGVMARARPTMEKYGEQG